MQSCKEEGTSDNSNVEMDAVYEEVMILNDAGDIKGALDFLDSAYHSLQPTDRIERFRYYEYCHGFYRRAFKDYDKALLYSDSMLLPFKGDNSGKYDELIAAGYGSRGDVLFALGNYEEAYNNYYQAKVLAAASKNSCATADHDYRMGMILYKQERYNAAARKFGEALVNVEDCAESFIKFYRKQELLDNIGLSYYYAGRNDSAILYYKRALAMIEANSSTYSPAKANLIEQARAVAYGNLATAYYKSGNGAEANSLLHKSIEINSLPGNDNIDAQSSRLKLANHYLVKGNTEGARPLLDDVQKISDTLYNESIALGLYKALSLYYRELEDIPQAYKYLKAYTDLRQASDVKSKKLAETDFNERFKNLQKEQEILALAKSNERKQEFLVLMVIAGVLSLGIGLFIVRLWRKSRQNVRVLSTLHRHLKEQKTNLEETLVELAKTSNEKDRILRAVSHDIRNPILAVTSLTELMQIDIDNYSDEHKEYISLIREACMHALNISNDLIEISATSPNRNVELQPTSLNEILNSCLNLLRFRASQKEQELIFEQSADIEVAANKEKIMRAISNLITNAIKFTPWGGIIIIKAIADGNNAVISIEDNGIGIPEKYKDKLFDLFTEAKRPGTGGEKPFGLGLSISRQIVEAHKGKIWFESVENKGTTFYISIPLNK